MFLVALILSRRIQMTVKFNRSRLPKWQKKIELGISNAKYLLQKANIGLIYSTFKKEFLL